MPYMLLVIVENLELIVLQLVIPIKTRGGQVLAEELCHKDIWMLGPPKFLIVDNDSAFTGEVLSSN